MGASEGPQKNNKYAGGRGSNPKLHVCVSAKMSRTVVFVSLDVEMGGLLVLKRIKIPPVGCPGFGFDKQLTFNQRKHIILRNSGRRIIFLVSTPAQILAKSHRVVACQRGFRMCDRFEYCGCLSGRLTTSGLHFVKFRSEGSPKQAQNSANL